MKTYILTIEYDEDTEEVEYISEELIEDTTTSLGNIDISEYYDEEILEYIEDCYIIGES